MSCRGLDPNEDTERELAQAQARTEVARD